MERAVWKLYIQEIDRMAKTRGPLRIEACELLKDLTDGNCYERLLEIEQDPTTPVERTVYRLVHQRLGAA